VSRRPALAVLLVLGLAALLRLQGLSRWSLDGDEVYSHYDVLELRAGQLSPGVRAYPVGYLLMAASTALLGTGELGLRAASAACGLAAVAALLLLRRDAVDTPAALLAGLLATLSPWLVYHAQEARFYAALLLFATLATLWALPGPGQRPWRALLCGGLAAACHPSALLLLPCLLVAPLSRRLPWRVVLGCAVAAAVAGAAWLLLGSGPLPQVVQEALARRALAAYDLLHFVAGLGYAIGPATGLLLLAGAIGAFRAPRGEQRLLLACALLPPLLLLPFSALGASVQQRYAMVAVPALLLLAGRALTELAGRPRLRLALVAAALLLPVPQLVAHAADGDRSDMRAAAAWLASHGTPDDLVVADEHATLDIYLLRHAGWERIETVEAPPPSPKMLRDFPRNRRHVWVVVKNNRLGGPYGADFDAWLQEHFVIAAEIGSPPPPLARHDNRLLVWSRRARVVDPP
jgi:mannosyltransferase